MPAGAGSAAAESNPISYPLGYFDAQVRFALRWADLSGEPIDKTLREKTALYRRLTKTRPVSGVAHPRWRELVAAISPADDPARIAKELYAAYLRTQQSTYASPTHREGEGRHFGFFSFDHRSQIAGVASESIRIHFVNKHRGERSGLDEMYLAQRQADLRRMFVHIRVAHPSAVEVLGASWLYALPAYRASFPSAFTRGMRRVMFENIAPPAEVTPGMAFGGDSLWGQFIDRRGGVRDWVYRAFAARMAGATGLAELAEAFPYPLYRVRAPITVFYDWIDAQGVEGE
jgi:hypothetical protein